MQVKPNTARVAAFADHTELLCTLPESVRRDVAAELVFKVTIPPIATTASPPLTLTGLLCCRRCTTTAMRSNRAASPMAGAAFPGRRPIWLFVVSETVRCL